MRTTLRWLPIAGVAIAAGGCAAPPRVIPPPAAVVIVDTARVPLNDLLTRTYRGLPGGLYPLGSDSMPADHAAAGQRAATAVVPRDVYGRPSASGRYVLISIGMSNTTEEWCSNSSAPPCDSWTFTGRAISDPAVNHGPLVIVNGAAPGKVAASWTSPSSAEYDRIRDTRLAPLGLDEKQVQAAWVKMADANPTTALPEATADAYQLEARLGDIVRALRSRYPNLQIVFLSSRIYGGYANTPLNPEPYAYESGFSVKWLIEAQISQTRGAPADVRAGDLDYRHGAAPWLAWGPYLWADGDNARSDGLTWARADLEADGTHPSNGGRAKIGAMLLDFFKSSPYAKCWFLAQQTCAPVSR